MTVIEQLMQQRGITRKQVFAVVGRAAYYRHIAKRADQRRRPQIDAAKGYCKLFGMTLDEFYAQLDQAS